ncbi:NADP-dependent oxidoreductase [Alterisphingorhabdus coralli]|uniref:NADP-dependent oxidoreductase n=1 Tax=Alterisphingorhabdus coralli TaxID=3071408 RepID=A0AA97I129_9SPHN|nr:NADP-dependent oxidoreductase [Parasphingorhabdus sp. SCSIO 66989]WOE75632.1 NADP-dependent oxidoreductase [Parasphingorhabdus sp. SCSIO 66989]
MADQQWVLSRRPEGRLHTDIFTLEEQPASEQPLAAGEVEVELRLFLCAPTMRNWMDPPGNNLYPSVPLGEAMLAPAGGRIIASNDPDRPVGADITCLGRWQSRFRLPGSETELVPSHLSLVDAMGQLGINPLTAWFGIHRIGVLHAGETLLVSGAAGSVGGVAVQLGRAIGARVVGIAGGPDKCRWLTETAGCDAAIDYQNEQLPEAIASACADGIDVFFDNVGGDTLDAAVDAMNRMGRIALCGQIAGYDGAAMRGPANMMRLIYGGITMRGFLVGDFAAEWETARADLKAQYESGAIVYRNDLREGFDQLPQHFGDLFQGHNNGTLLVMTDPGAKEARA